MKLKLFTFLCALLCVQFSMAQEPVEIVTESEETTTHTGTYAKRDDRTGYLFFQGLVGPNLSLNEDLRFGQFKHAVKWGTDVSFGKELSPFWWISLNVAYNKNVGMAHYSVTPRVYNTFNSMEIYATGAYSLTNGFLGFRPNRKGNLYAYLGLGFGYTFGLECRNIYYAPKDNNFALGFRMGLSYLRFLSKKVAFVGDLGIAGLGDSFNGRKAGVPLDIHTNLQVGVRLYMGHQGAPKWESKTIVKTVDRMVYQTDTLRVVDHTEVVTPAKVYPIFFTINSIEIRDSEEAKIKEMSEYMKQNPEKVVFILGYADRNTGNERINYYLGKNRSRVVSESLTQHYGIDPARIVTIIEEGDKVQPYKLNYENNRVAICIVTDFKE